ncbi:hypothetical protein [Streptomyces sp. NRRL F-4474]|uniref:hypothetical protein n=1 Tax=Streptomyces sp. NRRL F-4474 TaxID=1463851 RepID=UPI0004C8384F|nr:hypothetical protein [Streptomyces sp. NRRL F-4474]
MAKVCWSAERSTNVEYAEFRVGAFSLLDDTVMEQLPQASGGLAAGKCAVGIGSLVHTHFDVDVLVEVWDEAPPVLDGQEPLGEASIAVRSGIFAVYDFWGAPQGEPIPLCGPARYALRVYRFPMERPGAVPVGDAVGLETYAIHVWRVLGEAGDPPALLE